MKMLPQNLFTMKSSLIFTLFTLSLLFGCVKPKEDLIQTEKSSCPTPTNVIRTNKASGSISYSWSAVTGAVQYKLKYVRQKDNYTSPDYFTTSTSYTFSNLQSGDYAFYFYTVCSDGTSGAFINWDDVVIR
jgi:hypothetical protein